MKSLAVILFLAIVTNEIYASKDQDEADELEIDFDSDETMDYYVARTEHLGTWTGVNKSGGPVEFKIDTAESQRTAPSDNFDPKQFPKENYRVLFTNAGETVIRATIAPYSSGIAAEDLVYGGPSGEPELDSTTDSIRFMRKSGEVWIDVDPPILEGHTMTCEYLFQFQDEKRRLFVRLPMDMNDPNFVEKYPDNEEREEQFESEEMEEIDIGDAQIHTHSGHLYHQNPYVLVLTKSDDGKKAAPTAKSRIPRLKTLKNYPQPSKKSEAQPNEKPKGKPDQEKDARRSRPSAGLPRGNQ